jgi:thioredoxin-like negative regulator of GroEL
MTKDVSPEELERIKNEAKLVFCDVWAEWCGPCKSLGPILDELDNHYSSNPDVRFVKINADAHREFSITNKINAIPCVLVFLNGNPASFKDPHPQFQKKGPTDRVIGLRPPEHYEIVIKELLG